MEDKRISFKLAKLAKEKGFNLACDYAYTVGHANIQPNTALLPLYGLCKLGGNQPHLASAPTQSLLQKWIREKHGIHIVIIPTIESFWTYKTVTVISEKDSGIIKGISSVSDLPPYIDVCGYDFSTYETALEDALFESLNQLS